MPIISICNNKGGEGKSTVTVGLAEFLASQPKNMHRVLVIDLDRLASSAGALLGRPAVARAVTEGRTVVELMREIRDHRQPVSDLGTYLLTRPASGSRGMGLQEISVMLANGETMPELEAAMNWPDECRLFRSHLRPQLLERFDYVLIDHPANLERMTSRISMNGLVMSDFVLIPVRPTDISLCGLPATFSLVDAARDCSGTSSPKILGLLRNATDRRYQQYRINFPALLDASEDGELPPVFENFWPPNPAFETATDSHRQDRTLKERFGNAYDHVRKVTLELKKRCNGEEPDVVETSIWRRVLQGMGLM